MAVRFHELPAEVFPEEARPFIKRLNVELRDLFSLEGTISDPRITRRSDSTIARKQAVTVAATRIEPAISTFVSGGSTVVGLPALTFGLSNVIGSTTSATSTNSAIALFSTDTPPNSNAGAAIAGLSAHAANLGHAHQIDTGVPTIGYTESATGLSGTATTLMRTDATLVAPAFLRSAANGSTLGLADNGTNQTLDGSLGDLIITAKDDLVLTNTTSATDGRIVLIGAGTPAIANTKLVVEVVGPPSNAGCMAFFIQGSGNAVRTYRGINSLIETGNSPNQGNLGTFRALTADTRIRGPSKTVSEATAFLHAVSMQNDAADSVLSVDVGMFIGTAGFANDLGHITTKYGLRYLKQDVVNELNEGGVINSWGVVSEDHCRIESQAARAETALELRQGATGSSAGAHLSFDDKAGDASSPDAGDLWRNDDALRFRTSARSIDVVPTYFNPKDYGAVADGVTDDAPAIQAAHDGAEAIDGGTVFAPSGVYAIKTEMTWNRNVNLIGEHSTSNLKDDPETGTVFLRGADVIMLSIIGTDSTTDRRGRSTFRNIHFKDGSNISTKSWMFFKFCDNMRWVNCSFSEPSGQTTYGHVIDTEECWDWQWDFCQWSQYGGTSPDKHGVNWRNGDDNSANNWHFVGCRMYNGEGKFLVSDASGAHGDHNSQLHIDRCKFEDSSGTAQEYLSGPMSHVTVTSCEFVNSDGRMIAIDGFGNWYIAGNQFTNGGDVDTEMINVDGAINTVIIGNFFGTPGSSTTRFIHLDGTGGGGELKDTYIAGNNISEPVLGTTPLFAVTGTLHRTAVISGPAGDQVDDSVSSTTTLQPWGTARLNPGATGVSTTLGNGAGIGGFKTIVMLGTTASTLEVTNHETSDPEVFTFSAVDDTLVLMWTGTEWVTIESNGVSPSIDLSKFDGTLAIGNGGTGQTAKPAAFDALAPTTTKGDVIVYDGADNIRLAVGANTEVLTADSTQASGVKWAAGGGNGGGGDSFLEWAGL